MMMNYLTLYFTARPSFIITPRDKVVAVGRRLSIKCAVTGSPPPAVFWNKANSQVIIYYKKCFDCTKVITSLVLL